MTLWHERTAAFEPPSGWRRVLAVDAHTAGEPLRIIVNGFGPLAGDTILARRRDARARLDDLRRSLMWEPRGHADMYGCVVTEAVTSEADFGVLFTHNEGFSTMCGHGIIGVATAAVELGVVTAREPETVLGIDTPAGFVQATVDVRGGRAGAVRFVNVPSFAARLDASVDVPGVGSVTYDLAYGGAFYAYVDAASLGVGLTAGDYRDLIRLGRAIKEAVQTADPPSHPDDPDLGFLYGTIFVGPPENPSHHSRNVCVFADGEVDRSPTGTGVSGRVAIHHARGELDEGEAALIESILGTVFSARVVGRAQVGEHDAVVPEVGGRAYLTGRNELWIDPDDPLAGGFFLR